MMPSRLVLVKIVAAVPVKKVVDVSVLSVLSMVKPPVPEIAPDTASDCPPATFHVWAPPSAMALANEALTAEPVMSMPLVPRVRVPAPVMAMSVSAPVMLMPCQERLLPMVSPAPSEVEFHVAISEEPGTTLVAQLLRSVRSVPVPALV